MKRLPLAAAAFAPIARTVVDLAGAAEDVDLSYQAGLAFSRADARVDCLPASPFQRRP